MPGIEPRFLGCPVRSLVTIPSELPLYIAMKNNALFICNLSFVKLLRGRIQLIILAPNFSGNPTVKIVLAVWIPQVGFDLLKTLDFKFKLLPWTDFFLFSLP